MIRPFINWFTRGLNPGERAPTEAIFLRTLGLVYLVLFIVATATTRPHPGFHGKSLVIAIAAIVLSVCAVAAQPHSDVSSSQKRIALLLTVSACSAVLAALQPKGLWEAGPYFVGIVAAMRLERVAAVLTLAV